MKRKCVYLLKNASDLQIPFIEEMNLKLTTNITEFGIKTLMGGHSRRPEAAGAKMYGKHEILKYVKNKRNEIIQVDMTLYALKLLDVRQGFYLDIGCGCGISSKLVKSRGNFVVGIDISSELLEHAALDNSSDDFVQLDVSRGLNFRPCSFHYVLSISVLQWFINEQTLLDLFKTLHCVLCDGGKAVFQFYPRSIRDVDILMNCAEKYFTGCFVGDYPSTNRGIKLFLYLLKLKM